jgi:hypothetical protein
MDDVYMLWHIEPENDDSERHEFLIGVYSTRANAEAAIERKRDQPGFRTHMDGFEIHETRLDLDYWSEGYDRRWPDGSFTSADD